MPPRVPKLGKAVEEEHHRPTGGSCLDDVHVEAQGIELVMYDGRSDQLRIRRHSRLYDEEAETSASDTGLMKVAP
jgi:hypothetical protein